MTDAERKRYEAELKAWEERAKQECYSRGWTVPVLASGKADWRLWPCSERMNS